MDIIKEKKKIHSAEYYAWSINLLSLFIRLDRTWLIINTETRLLLLQSKKQEFSLTLLYAIFYGAERKYIFMKLSFFIPQISSYQYFREIVEKLSAWKT